MTTDVAVGQMRAFEFDALAGDWAIHCHKSHHTMNAMGHGVPMMIGVDHRGVAEKILRLVPDCMVMGERGRADMGTMEMPLPNNTRPMMTGSRPFGAVAMSGMISVVKVRDDVRRGGYRDPGAYAHLPGTVASKYTGEIGAVPRAAAAAADAATLKVHKPSGHEGH